MTQIEAFFDQATFTLTYIVYQGSDAIVIDPVWDYDPISSSLSTHSLQKVVSFLKEKNLKPLYSLETHAHADHISSAQLLKKEFPAMKIAIGEKITTVQKRFAEIFNLSIPTDGSQFDVLLKENEILSAGSLTIKTFSTPGHTPACCCFLINDQHLFTGDALFMPDFGTGRCDFPDGDAAELYDTVHEKIYGLNDSIMTYTGHDYQPGGRELRYSAPLSEQKEHNVHLKATTTKEEYVAFRTGRDANLSEPKLLLPSIQININAGQLPAPESNGISFLKIPLR